MLFFLYMKLKRSSLVMKFSLELHLDPPYLGGMVCHEGAPLAIFVTVITNFILTRMVVEEG